MYLQLMTFLPIIHFYFNEIVENFCEQSGDMSTIVIYNEDSDIKFEFVDNFLDFFTQQKCQLLNPKFIMDLSEEKYLENSPVNLGGCLKNLIILNNLESVAKLKKLENFFFWKPLMKTIIVIKDNSSQLEAVRRYNKYLAELKVLRVVTILHIDQEFRAITFNPYKGNFLMDITDNMAGSIFRDNILDLSETKMATFQRLKNSSLVPRSTKLNNKFEATIFDDLEGIFKEKTKPLDGSEKIE